MSDFRQRLYACSPGILKEWLVAAEARRRNYYRRYGDYASVRKEYDLAKYRELSNPDIRGLQFRFLRELVAYAREKSSFYRARLPRQLERLEDVAAIPILSKEDIRNNMADITTEPVRNRAFYIGRTSGSTGTPLEFRTGREGIRARYAIQDNYYAMYGCHYGERRVRLGGSQIKPAKAEKPPFWIYNRVDNQLQMSPWHIDSRSINHYMDEIERFRPKYFTGYAHALYRLAEHLWRNEKLTHHPKAIFTDSEGAPPEYYRVIEEGFQAPCHDVYGISETGWIAVQCRHDVYHVLQLSCVLEVVDGVGRPLPYGQTGRLVVTDLTQKAVPYIRYDTGDLGSVSEAACECGWRTEILECLEGRSDDYVLTPQGRRVGRLSHVTKPGRGILESQIAQTARDRIVIRVVPTESFEAPSMKAVVKTARERLGTGMQVEWELVDAIPRTKRGKFKHVVREIDD